LSASNSKKLKLIILHRRLTIQRLSRKQVEKSDRLQKTMMTAPLQRKDRVCYRSERKELGKTSPLRKYQRRSHHITVCISHLQRSHLPLTSLIKTALCIF